MERWRYGSNITDLGNRWEVSRQVHASVQAGQEAGWIPFLTRPAYRNGQCSTDTTGDGCSRPVRIQGRAFRETQPDAHATLGQGQRDEDTGWPYVQHWRLTSKAFCKALSTHAPSGTRFPPVSAFLKLAGHCTEKNGISCKGVWNTRVTPAFRYPLDRIL
jgi:hypothetical protein